MGKANTNVTYGFLVYGTTTAPPLYALRPGGRVGRRAVKTDGYATPGEAALAALLSGYGNFTVVRIAGPAGFYAAYRTYANGRVTTAPVTLRPGSGRGYGYGPGVRR